MFGAHQWTERLYEKEGRTVRLFVGRSYDQKKLYHHPEIALSRGVDLEKGAWVKVKGMPVHVMRSKNGDSVAAYVLLYDGRFVSDPVYNQLRHAFWQLFHPRRSITLFYVSESGVRPHADFEESNAAHILEKAVMAFLDRKNQGDSP